jgi:hypothetical protein
MATAMRFQLIRGTEVPIFAPFPALPLPGIEGLQSTGRKSAIASSIT